MTEKIKNMKEIAQKTGDKEAISVVRQLELIKFKSMNATQIIGDLFGRAITISAFIVISNIIQMT